MPNTDIDVKKVQSTRASLFEPWQSFRSEMDRLFDRVTKGFGPPMFDRFFDTERALPALSLPAVDISEDDKAYTIAAELPGLEEKDVEVTTMGDTLILKGEKRQEKQQKDKNYYLSERSYGAFQRSFALPDSVDQNKIAASFAKGVLTVTLPKTAEARDQQRKIEVKTS